MGRPAIRADGVPLTSSEKSRRYREKRKREREELFKELEKHRGYICRYLGLEWTDLVPDLPEKS